MDKSFLDIDSIGSTRSSQDPMDAIKRKTGTYKDVVEDVSPETRFYPERENPKAPDPKPY